MEWLTYGIGATLFKAVNNTAYKFTINEADPFLIVLISSLAFFATTLLFLGGYIVINNTNVSSLYLTTKGIKWSIFLGVTVGIVDILFVMAFARGAPLGAFIILYHVLSLIIIVSFSVLYFKEAFTLQKSLGILLGMAGIVLLLWKKGV